MSDSKNRRSHKKTNGKGFIILPIIFCLLTYILVFAVTVPTVAPVVSAAGLFFSDGEKDYSTEYDNIFVPVADDSVSTVEKDGEKYVDLENVEYPSYGDMFGELIIDDCGVDANLFFGDGDVALRNGVGIYSGSFIPGYGRTILVAGHNNTYFKGLKNAEEGQIIRIKTSYGNYEYKITSTAVKSASDSTAYDLSADYENLVLYTCYPFDELGLTSKRFFVYAELVSGYQLSD